jgi:aldehyde:ferredoxin oxidoreductase
MEGMHDTMLGSDSPSPELGITRSYDRFTLVDKPHPAKAFEDLRSFTNSLILCCFTTRSVGERYNFPQIRSLLEAATGCLIDAAKMLKIGERNYALMRILSTRAGHRMEGDGLPSRFFEPLPLGSSAGHPIDPETFREVLEAYYQERGYDRFGPTDARLRALGLEDCIGMIPR